jgi:hypothetical protein
MTLSWNELKPNGHFRPPCLTTGLERRVEDFDTDLDLDADETFALLVGLAFAIGDS